MRHAARQHGLPRVVYTSPLQRCWRVGRILRAWGWAHHVDDSLMEASFGRWDGLAWTSIDRADVDAWVADFVAYHPGGGESLKQILDRASQWMPNGQGGMLVGHGGWMLARRWVSQHFSPPAGAHEWPRPPAYGQCWILA